MHAVSRQRDLEVWRALVSIMVKNTTASHFHQLLLKVTLASSDLDFELNRSSDPLAKRGYKFIEILKASIIKLKYSWNKQMNKTSSKLTNFTCSFSCYFSSNCWIRVVINRPISLSLLASHNFTIKNESPASGIGNLSFQQLLQRLINLSSFENKVKENRVKVSFPKIHGDNCHFCMFRFAIAVWGSRFAENGCETIFCECKRPLWHIFCINIVNTPLLVARIKLMWW